MDLTLVVQGLLNGFLFGGVYSLMAVGLTLIFGVMRVVNFAHGDMMVWGMYLAWLGSTRLGVDPYLGFLGCAAALFALGLGTQRVLVNRIVDAPHEMQILLMLGVALVHAKPRSWPSVRPRPRALAAHPSRSGGPSSDVARLDVGVAMVTIALTFSSHETDLAGMRRPRQYYGPRIAPTAGYAVDFGIGARARAGGH